MNPNVAPHDPKPILWERLVEIFPATGPGSIANYIVHEHDLSIELYFAPETPTAWVPSTEQFITVSTLADFVTVYGNFPDDTEIIGGWRQRSQNGLRSKEGAQWVMGQVREPVGTPRYASGMADRTIVLRGRDAGLFREFITWKATNSSSP